MSRVSKFFNPEAPLWAFMSTLADALILHFIWLVCSLPIVSFGASTTALYCAMMKNLNGECTSCIHEFFKSFKANFKQCISLGLIFLFGSVLMLFIIQAYFASESSSKMPQFLGTIQVMIFILFFFTFEYAFPLMARFENTVFQTLKNGFLMSIRHFGSTFIMTTIVVAVYFVAFYYNIWPILFFGFGLVVMLDSYILNRVMKPYLEKAMEQTKDEEMED